MKNVLKNLTLTLIALTLFNCSSETVNETTTATQDAVVLTEQYNYYGKLIDVSYNSNGKYIEEGLSKDVITALETGIFTNGEGERNWYLFNNEQDLDAWSNNESKTQRSNRESFNLYEGFNQTGITIYKVNVTEKTFKYPPANVRARAGSYLWGFKAANITMAYGTNGTKAKRTYTKESISGNLRQYVSNADLNYLWRVKWSR